MSARDWWTELLALAHGIALTITCAAIAYIATAVIAHAIVDPTWPHVIAPGAPGEQRTITLTMEP